MKISVNAKVVFRFPTCLILNRLSVGILRRRLKKEGVKLSRRQTVLFMKECRKYKKRAPDWNLVEVTGHTGNTVTVRI